MEHVSILGMLEGVLKARKGSELFRISYVSILGMLEGVLKVICRKAKRAKCKCFNPWYVGGGVKSEYVYTQELTGSSFNPWYVGGGVKRLTRGCAMPPIYCFNPWYVGGGVKRVYHTYRGIQ